ncbi:MAG: ABC transporter ATP-binding protein, partial [Collinsella sp.]
KVLTDVSFTAKEGEVTALVGPSGSGKSTVSRLAARFWDATAGKVAVGGVDVAGVDPEVLLRDYAIVFQDVLLFDDTVMGNIRLGRRDATDEEVLAAARAANCDEFVNRMPQGYDTRVANDAESISQGQRQLLTIARVLLNNPAILILDEATSSVDTRTELAIGRAMDALMRGRTSFVIAHRLSTIVDADLILVMDHGNIIEQGTHKELLAAEGAYADLYLSQFA